MERVRKYTPLPNHTTLFPLDFDGYLSIIKLGTAFQQSSNLAFLDFITIVMLYRNYITVCYVSTRKRCGFETMTGEKLKVLACGGTIDKVYFDAKSQFQVGEPQIVTVLRESNVSINYVVESIVQKDSLELTDDDRQKIRATVEATSEKRVLITHGTDTMIETAKVLANIKGKTIVLTGSMEPAKFKVTDAAFNIGCAVTAVQILPAGVYLAMHGRIFYPEHVAKNVGENRFEEV